MTKKFNKLLAESYAANIKDGSLQQVHNLLSRYLRVFTNTADFTALIEQSLDADEMIAFFLQSNIESTAIRNPSSCWIEVGIDSEGKPVYCRVSKSYQDHPHADEMRSRIRIHAEYELYKQPQIITQALFRCATGDNFSEGARRAAVRALMSSGGGYTKDGPFIEEFETAVKIMIEDAEGKPAFFNEITDYLSHR